MTGLILKLVLVILVLRAVLRLFRGVLQGLSGVSTAPRAMALVRDPVCGTFVAPSTALSLASGGQTQFFCSEKCRRDYELNLAQ